MKNLRKSKINKMKNRVFPQPPVREVNGEVVKFRYWDGNVPVYFCDETRECFESWTMGLVLLEFFYQQNEYPSQLPKPVYESRRQRRRNRIRHYKVIRVVEPVFRFTGLAKAMAAVGESAL